MLLMPLVGPTAIAYTVWLPPPMFGFQPSSVGLAPESPTRRALLRVAWLVGLALLTTRKLLLKRPPTATKLLESQASVFTEAAGSVQAELPPDGVPTQTPADQLLRATEESWPLVQVS